MMIRSFIHAEYFYSASSSLLLLRDRRSRLQHRYSVGVNTPKRHKLLHVKNLPKVLMWRREWDSNLRPSGRKAPNSEYSVAKQDSRMRSCHHTILLGMYRVQFFTEYRVFRRFFTGTEYRVFNKLVKVEEK